MKNLFATFCILIFICLNVTAQTSALSDCNAGASPGCPSPYPYPPQTFTAIQGRDNGLTLFVGGNLVIKSGGSELEGKSFVYGNFDVQKTTGVYNVGFVGAGSYVLPDNGSDMLIVGGNIASAGATIYYGGFLTTPLTDIPGNIRYKGSVTNPTKFMANDIPGGTDGMLISDPGLNLTPYSNEISLWSNRSTAFSGLAASSNSTFTNSFGSYTIASTDGASGTYVINIPGDLDPGYSTTLTMSNFPDNAEILINMLKSGTVNVNLANFFFSGISGNADKLMERVLWNFPNATTVNIKGSSQFRGAILSKATDTYVDGSTNGRLFSTGNVIQGNTSSGLEFHNYPFRGAALIVLPVNLESFTAKPHDSRVLIGWASSNESGSSHYEVERSFNGIQFTSIGSVASKNSQSLANYQFTDNNPVKGTSYYRLKMVDLDGKVEYSKTIRIELQHKGSILIYPNPASGEINIVSENLTPGKPVTVSLLDASGKKSFERQMVPSGKKLLIKLPQSLSDGMYFLHIDFKSGKGLSEPELIYIQRK